MNMKSKPLVSFTNISTEDKFHFKFHCDRCGAGKPSEQYAFNLKDFSVPPKGKAYDLLWTKQHDEAYERANSEARYDFNICPRCGRWVCNKCFHSTSYANEDFCLDCKRDLESASALSSEKD